MGASLWIDNVPAESIATHTPPTWEMGADGGTLSISWAMGLSSRVMPTELRPGALVQVRYGMTPVASAILDEPDRTTWECRALGIGPAGNNYVALDSLLNGTREVGEAIDRAQAAGWPVENFFLLGGPADGDALPVSVATLLTDQAEALGRRWGVTGGRVLYMRPDPTVPRWVIAPEAGSIGETSEGAATHLVGRYDTGAGYATVIVGVDIGPRREEIIDLTPRGTLTEVQAEGILNGILALRPRTNSWTNGLTLTADQITTVGGQRAFLPHVAGSYGQAARIQGLSSAESSLYVDEVIGKTRYTAGSDVIYLEPVNTAPRTYADLIAAA